MLKSFQAADSETKLVLPETQRNQSLNFNKIDTNRNTNTNFQRLEKTLKFVNPDTIEGDITVTSMSPYNVIKKKETKRILQTTFRITIMLNDLFIIQPTEIGFFIHHHVRYDTASSTKCFEDILPSDVPPFQPEITNIWAGTANRRRVTAVKKIYTALSNSEESVRIFEETFRNSQHNTFLSKEFFSTLEPPEKIKINESQISYQKKYGSLIIQGIENIYLPTIVEVDNINLNIQEWMHTIPDYQHNKLFTLVQQISHTTIEVQFRTSNLVIAQKWTRNAISHIARVLRPYQFSSAFTTTADITIMIEITEEWNPPPPPIINLYPSNPWGNNTTRNTKSRKSNKSSYSIHTDLDSQSTTTATTIQSNALDTISDLHSDSAIQHLTINANNDTFNQVEQNIQDTFSTFQQRLDIINSKQQEMSKQHENFSNQINFFSKSIPSIVHNMDKQQTQLLSMIDQQNTINKSYSNEIQTLRKQQNQQATVIQQLQQSIIVKTTNSHTTPNSLQHAKKKSRQSLDDSDMSPPVYNTAQEEETIYFANDTSILLDTQDNEYNGTNMLPENQQETEDEIFLHTQTNLQQQFETLNNTRDLDPHSPEKDT